jgi:hypothetical protein
MESRSKAKVSGESKFEDKRVRLSSAAMAGPQSQNPKGSCVMLKMRGNVLSLYHSNDL